MNKRSVRILTLILSCLILIGAAVGITVAAENNEPAVSIYKRNISYDSTVRVMYAVDGSKAGENNTVRMVFSSTEITEEALKNKQIDSEDLKAYSVKSAAGTTTVSGKEYLTFYSDGVFPKNYRLSLYAAAVVVDESGRIVAVDLTPDTADVDAEAQSEQSSAAESFNPYDYAMTRFDGEKTDAQFKLYKSLLDYGGAVQYVLGYRADLPENDPMNIKNLGGWVDAYYNVTVDLGDGNGVQDLTGKRATEVNHIIVAARTKTENDATHKFAGFLDNGKPVFEHGDGEDGMTSSAWNEFTIRPGNHTYTVKYEAPKENETITADGIDGTADGAAPSVPAYIKNVSNSDTAQKVTVMSDEADGNYFIRFSQLENKAGAQQIKFNARNDNLHKVSYEYDFRFVIAENLRPDNTAIYLKYYGVLANGTNNYTDVSASVSVKNGTFGIGSNISGLEFNEWHNIRFEFTKNERDFGYNVTIFVDGKAALFQVGNTSEYVNYQYVPTMATPYMFFESRWHDAKYRSDIVYDIDNVRVDEEKCTEHKYADKGVEHSAYLQTKATCTDGAFYYKTCSVCGTVDKNSTFESEILGNHTYSKATCQAVPTCTVCGSEDPNGKKADHAYAPATCTEPEKCTTCAIVKEGSVALGHDYAQLCYPEAIKAFANATAPTVYYYSCNRCGELDKTREFPFGKVETYYGSVMTLPEGMTSSRLNGKVVDGLEDGVKIAERIASEEVEGVLNYYLHVEKKNEGTSNDTRIKVTYKEGVTNYYVSLDFKWGGTTSQSSNNPLYIKGMKDATGNAEIFGALQPSSSKVGADLSFSGKMAPVDKWVNIVHEFIYDEANGKWANHIIYVNGEKAMSTSSKDNSGGDLYLKYESRWGGGYHLHYGIDNVLSYYQHECDESENKIDAYKKNDGNCTTETTYYYSCSVCGSKSDKTFGTGYVHNFEEIVLDGVEGQIKTPATCTEQAVYYTACACGALNKDATFSAGELAPHSNHNEVAIADALRTPANGTSPATYYKTCGECGAIDKNDALYFVFGKAEKYYGGTKTLPDGFGSANALSDYAVDGYTTLMSVRVASDAVSNVVNYFIKYKELNTTSQNNFTFSQKLDPEVSTYYFQHDFRWYGASSIRDTNWPLTIKLTGTSGKPSDGGEGPINDGSASGELHNGMFNLYTKEGDKTATIKNPDLSTVPGSAVINNGEWVTLRYEMVRNETAVEANDRYAADTYYNWTVTLYVNGEFAGTVTTQYPTKNVPGVRYEPRYSSSTGKNNNQEFDFDNVLCYYEHECAFDKTVVAEAYRADLNKFYKSCGICGKASTSETFETDTEHHVHVFEREGILPEDANLYVAATCTEKARYFKLCNHCDTASNYDCDVISPDLIFVDEESTPLGHDMADATCTLPQICKRGCGHTEGNALGHDMAPATCTDPSTCKRGCGHTEGEALGHDFTKAVASEATLKSPATCTDKATYYYTCNVCDVVEKNDEHTFTVGDPLGHVWVDATCTAPKTCSRCNATEGEALGHDYKDTVLENDANLASVVTYKSPAKYYKVCARCGGYSTETFDVGDVLTVKIGYNLDTGAFTPGDIEGYLKAKVGDSIILPNPVLENYYCVGLYYGDTLVGAPGATITWTIEEPEVTLTAKWATSATSSYNDKANLTGSATDYYNLSGYDSSVVDLLGTQYVFKTNFTYHGLSSFLAGSGDGTSVDSKLLPATNLEPNYIRFIGTSAVINLTKSSVGGDLVDAEGNVVAKDGVLLPDYINEDGTAKIAPANIYFKHFKWYGITYEIAEEYEVTITITMKGSGKKPTYQVVAKNLADGTVQTSSVYTADNAANNIKKFYWESRSGGNAGNAAGFTNKVSFTETTFTKYAVTTDKVTLRLDATNYGEITDTTATTEWQVYPNTPMTYELPTPEFKGEGGYEFLGWYDGDTLVESGNPHTIDGDTTLVAKWVKNSTITLGETIENNYVVGDNSPEFKLPGYGTRRAWASGSKVVFSTEFTYLGAKGSVTGSGTEADPYKAKSTEEILAYVSFDADKESDSRHPYFVMYWTNEDGFVNQNGVKVADSNGVVYADATIAADDIISPASLKLGSVKLTFGVEYDLKFTVTMGKVTYSADGTADGTDGTVVGSVADADGNVTTLTPSGGATYTKSGSRLAHCLDCFSLYFRGKATSGIKCVWKNSSFDVTEPISENVVTLNPNNGTDALGTIEVMYGQEYTLPEDPTLADHIFLGWYLGDTKVESSGTWNYYSDLTLKAKWHNAWTEVTFSTDVEGEFAKQTYKFNEPWTLPTSGREGFEVVWLKDGVRFDPTGDAWDYNDFELNLTAEWHYAYTEVTFNTDLHDQTIESITYYFDKPFELPTLTVGDYMITGWYNGNDLFDPQGDHWDYDSHSLELTAKWARTSSNSNDFTVAEGETAPTLNGVNINKNDISYANGEMIFDPVDYQPLMLKPGATVTDPKAGMVYVVEFDFTYNGATPSSITRFDGAGWLGFNTTNGTNNNNMIVAYDLSKFGSDGDGDGYCDYFTMLGQNFYLGDKVTVRIEYVVGSGKNGTLYIDGVNKGTLSGSNYVSSKGETMQSFGFYFRYKETFGDAIFALDNTYCGVETYPEKVTLDLDPDMGTLPENVTSEWKVYPGAPMTYTLPIPTLEGYAFRGWYNGDTKVESGTITVSEKTTLIAKWAKIEDVALDKTESKNATGTVNFLDSKYAANDYNVSGTKYLFDVDYTYHGLSAFSISEDGVVTELAPMTGSQHFGFYGFLATTNGDVRLNHTTAVKGSGTFVDKQGKPVVGEDGKTLTAEYLAKFKAGEFTAKDIYYSAFTWGGMVFEMNKTYHISAVLTLGTVFVSADGTVTAGYSSATITATEAESGAVQVGKFNNGAYSSSPKYDCAGFAFMLRSAGSVKVSYYTMEQSYANVVMKKYVPIEECKITFNTNEGAFAEGTEGAEGVNVKTTFTIPALPTPERTDYDFLGWYYGDTLVKEGDVWMSVIDVEFTAKWRVAKTYVAFDAVLDGVTVDVQPIEYGAEKWTLPTPTKEGYEFIGWYDESGNLYASGDVWTLEELNLTLTAKWYVVSVGGATGFENGNPDWITATRMKDDDSTTSGIWECLRTEDGGNVVLHVQKTEGTGSNNVMIKNSLIGNEADAYYIDFQIRFNSVNAKKDTMMYIKFINSNGAAIKSSADGSATFHLSVDSTATGTVGGIAIGELVNASMKLVRTSTDSWSVVLTFNGTQVTSGTVGNSSFSAADLSGILLETRYGYTDISMDIDNVITYSKTMYAPEVTE